MHVQSFNDIIVEMTKPNFNPHTIKVISGLGNPGPEYSETYHNIGMEYVTKHVEKYIGVQFQSEKKWRFSHARLNTREWVLCQTFMNESGIAIKAALKWFNASPEELLVVHDDSDLPAGTVRVEYGRGAAGHNGVLSIINALGTDGFWRARVGIRMEIEGNPREKAETFVLKKISSPAREKIKLAFADLDRVLDQGDNK